MRKEDNPILSTIGITPVSGTQQLRVDLVEGVKDEEVRVTIQRWWRKDTDSEWSKGKGLHLTMEEAKSIKALLEKATA